MRNIRKKIKACEMEVIVYDRVLKIERTEVVTVSEVDDTPNLPENCILIDKKVVEGSEREVLYIMPPKDFVKHAKIIELAADTESSDGEE
jgi:hypothetical protein